ncbi:hypothetical protein [Bartonella sp. DGB2]|uniref:hypothetical protein n=1 Tax=Bartonella sp. DGB2 TaxID=3388426 RepID=UPI00398F923A
MKKNYIDEMREMILAKQISCIIPEIKMVGVGDFIACLHYERYGNISDIIDAATELYFYPQTIRFANKGEYKLGWDTFPTITLYMEFSNEGVNSQFHMIMDSESFGIEIDDTIFEIPSDDETETRIFMQALNNARLPRSKQTKG